MGGVVTAQGVDERAVADKPVLVYMAREMQASVGLIGVRITIRNYLY